MDTSRRHFCAGLAAVSLAPACSVAAAGDELTPEAFGAKGDGRTNDTLAFAALCAHVNARGGGTIVLRPVVYSVGMQVGPDGKSRRFAFNPVDILHFAGCTAPIVIQGNGAILRAAPGLRFGGFDRFGKGLPESRSNLDVDKRAVPYLGMIHAEKCSGGIEITDIELDGNLQSLRMGGRYGRGGWQAAGSGLRFSGNSGPETLTRIFSHHHPQDGILLSSTADRSASTVVSDCISENNGRQGCSITGGRNYDFQRCKFRKTGRAGIRGSPAAGVDIEAEGGRTIRNLSFNDCEFSDNAGFGIAAGTGDTEGATFSNCTFVGTTNWAAWPEAPRFRFSNCLFVGQIIHAYGDPDPQRATQFMDCTFTDDPGKSPTGQVFQGISPSLTIAVLLNNQNVLFSRCHFDLKRGMTLPMSAANVIYSDCTMSQASAYPSRPRGTYLGTTTITGNADLSGSAIRGTVILNGRALPPTG